MYCYNEFQITILNFNITECLECFLTFQEVQQLYQGSSTYSDKYVKHSDSRRNNKVGLPYIEFLILLAEVNRKLYFLLQIGISACYRFKCVEFH